MSDPAKTQGTVTLTCKNHPSYRWVQTKYTLPGETRTYGGDGVLMFKGEDDGLPASYFNISEAKLKTYDKAFQKQFRENHTPECDCPIDDLVFLAWTD